MKISAKGRYGIAAMVFLARNYDASSPITIISISEHLGISKIYPREINAYDVLSSIEISLIEKAGPATDKMDALNRMLSRCVFDELDRSILETLRGISLEDLLTALNHEETDDSLMYFI